MAVLQNINIAALSDANVKINVNVDSLNISFKQEALSFNVEIVTTSNDPRIGTKTAFESIEVNNNNRIPVLNADGSPSIINVKATGGQVIQDMITPPEEIYGPLLDENNEPVLDDDGQPIQTVISTTPAVYANRTAQETIGEFYYWELAFPQLIAALEQAVIRNVDPTVSNEISYTKPA